jgi:catalase
MNGYGSHTFKTVNAQGEAFYVKWHFKTDQGIKCLSVEDADKLAGGDPEYSIRDLYNAIADGDFPSWTVYVQVMTFDQAERTAFNPFDVTKIWPHSSYPLIEVGRMTLNRNPENYFAEVEQLAFAPSHLVPGIEPSPDKMLQGRLFSYADTHRHRLGKNYQTIPVNCPFATRTLNYQRDGPMVVDGNQGGAPNYFPNSFGGPEPSSSGSWHSYPATGDVTRYETGDEDNFSQCGDFYRRVLSPAEKERLTDNIAGNLSGAQEFLQQRAIANFAAADAEYGRSIQRKLDAIKKAKAGKLPPNKKASVESSMLSPPRTVPKSSL